MPKSIELQPNGSLLFNGEVVGEIAWQTVWPYDFARVWYAYDPDEDLKGEVHRLRDALSRSEAKLRRAEQDLQKALKSEGVSA